MEVRFTVEEDLEQISCNFGGLAKWMGVGLVKKGCQCSGTLKFSVLNLASPRGPSGLQGRVSCIHWTIAAYHNTKSMYHSFSRCPYELLCLPMVILLVLKPLRMS